MQNSGKLKKWQLIEANPGPEVPLFNIEIKRYRNPRNGLDLDAIVLHANPSVNIICVTKEHEILLVEQFRFGSAQFHLELPAGLVDPGETTLQAAQRELLEETGYMAGNWKSLGMSYLNPAYVDNTCEHFLATDAELVRDVHLDQLEDIAIHRAPYEDFPQLVKRGVICDGISRAAYAMLGLVDIRNTDT